MSSTLPPPPAGVCAGLPAPVPRHHRLVRRGDKRIRCRQIPTFTCPPAFLAAEDGTCAIAPRRRHAAIPQDSGVRRKAPRDARPVQPEPGAVRAAGGPRQIGLRPLGRGAGASGRAEHRPSDRHCASRSRRLFTRRMELAGSRVRGAAGPVCAFAPARPGSLPSRQPPIPALPTPRPRRRSASFACWPKRPATRIGLAISS
jgi:hypothetical protein